MARMQASATVDTAPPFAVGYARRSERRLRSLCLRPAPGARLSCAFGDCRVCSSRSRRSRTATANLESRLDFPSPSELFDDCGWSSLPRALADNQLAITGPGLCVRKGMFEHLERPRRGDRDREGLVRLPVDHLDRERVAPTIPQQAHVDTARRARREFNQNVHLLTLGVLRTAFAPLLASFDLDPRPRFRVSFTAGAARSLRNGGADHNRVQTPVHRRRIDLPG